MFIKKGGFINYPTFISRDIPLYYGEGEKKDILSCLSANEHKRITDDSEYNRLIPLYELRIYIKTTCDIDNFVLDDIYNNHIFFEPLTLTSTDLVHHFKLTPTMQIQYLGTVRFSDYNSIKKDNIYDFDKFLTTTYTNISDKYLNLIELHYCSTSSLLVNIIKRSKKIVLKDGKEINMPTLQTFVSNIVGIDENDNIIYHNNFNIINIFIFMNKINLLYDIVDEVYNNILEYKEKLNKPEKLVYNFDGSLIVNYNELFKITDIDDLFTKLKEKLLLIPEHLQMTFLDNLDYLQELEPLKEYRKAVKTVYEDVIYDDKYSNIINIVNLNRIKSNIINYVRDRKDTDKYIRKIKTVKSYEFLEVLVFAITLIKKLFTEGKLNKEYVIDTFNYAVIGTEYLRLGRVKDDISKTNLKIEKIKEQITEQTTTGVEVSKEVLINLKKEEELLEKLKKEEILRKNNIDEYSVKSRSFIYLEFIKYVYNFIKDIYKIKNEFVQYNIYNFKQHIKLIIGLIYYNFLRHNSSLLPISLYTHCITFNSIHTGIDQIIKPHYFNFNTKFEIFKFERINIDGNKFLNCGEITLLNLIRYLLYDTKEGKITSKLIETLHYNFSDNLLKDIFLVEDKSSSEQNIFLKTKITEFIKLFSFGNALEDNIYNIRNYEIKPSLLNSMKVLQKLLNSIYRLTSNDDAIFMIRDISKKLNKNIVSVSSAGEIIYYRDITFAFHKDHSEAKYTKKSNTELLQISMSLNGKYRLLYNIEKSSVNYLFMTEVLPLADETNNYFELNYKAYEFIDKILYTNTINLLYNINDNEFVNYIGNVNTLTFGDNFNQEILPNTLNNVTTLTFGSNFNQEILPNTLNNVTTLTFGFEFNKPILPNTLNNVTTLTFGTKFNQEILPNTLNNVTTLTFGFEFNKPIFPNTLNNVTTITFGDNFDQQIIPIFPNTLNNVTTITFGDNFDQQIIPNTLNKVIELSFGYDFNQQIIPNTLNEVKTLTFSTNFNQPILENTLNNVTTVIFGFMFDQPILENTLVNVTTIYFSKINKRVSIHENSILNLRKILMLDFNSLLKSKIIYSYDDNICNDKQYPFLNNLKKRINPVITGGSYYHKYLKYKYKYLNLQKNNKFSNF